MDGDELDQLQEYVNYYRNGAGHAEESAGIIDIPTRPPGLNDGPSSRTSFSAHASGSGSGTSTYVAPVSSLSLQSLALKFVSRHRPAGLREV